MKDINKMANVRFNKKIFEKEIGKLDDQLLEKIALFGTPVETVNDTEIEIEIFPNRPDLLSYYGFKRGFLAFLGKKKGLREYKLNKPEKDYEVKIDSSVSDVRPYTACAIVRDLKLDDSKIKDLIEVQEKLHSTIGRKRKKLAIGIYPLEKIELPITYSAIEPDKIRFQPLESAREMSGLEILQRHPAGRDYAHLLQGKAKFPVFMDKEKNILSMPPIINSEKTGRVLETTKSVFVECSGFEKDTLEKCLSILVTSLSEMGGKIYQMKVGGEVMPTLEKEKMKISLEETNKLLGINLKEKELKQLIERMGHNYSSGEVEIASYRTDILHEVDLIEDIAIAYGYENFSEEIPKISTIGSEDFSEIFKRKIAEVLIGLGLLEVSNYHLSKLKDQFEKMGVSEKEETGFVELEESKTDYGILRKDLTHYLLKNISENSDSEYPQNIFELGKVFGLDGDKLSEKEKLSCSFTPGNFTKVVQILEYLGSNFGLKFEIKEQSILSPYFIDGRSGDIFLENKKIGEIGEIHPKILKNWKIKMPVSLFEIDLENVFEKLKN